MMMNVSIYYCVMVVNWLGLILNGGLLQYLCCYLLSLLLMNFMMIMILFRNHFYFSFLLPFIVLLLSKIVLVFINMSSGKHCNMTFLFIFYSRNRCFYPRIRSSLSFYFCISWPFSISILKLY